jgi:hypothetical protein
MTGAEEGRISGWSAADLTRRRVPQPVVCNTSNITSKQKTPLGAETSSKDVMVSVLDGFYFAQILAEISTRFKVSFPPKMHNKMPWWAHSCHKAFYIYVCTQH